MDEVVPMVSFLFADSVEIDPAAREKALSGPRVSEMLRAARSTMSDVEPYDTASLEAALKALPEALDVKPKVLFQAVRVAVTGSTVSLPLFESLELLGRETSVRRMDAAIALVNA
jgi:glutamyl-tRNA synthetase